MSSQAYAEVVVDAMAKALNGIELDYRIKDRADGPYLMIEVAKPSERIFRVLREAQISLVDEEDENPFVDRATVSVRQREAANRLSLPETQLLKTTLSESLTVDRYTFGDDFFGRYIPSVFGYEDQIVTSANFLVYGRRGSGKSSLLAYAMHKCIAQNRPYVWIDFQTFANRADPHISVDVLQEIVSQLRNAFEVSSEYSGIHDALLELGEIDEASVHQRLLRLLPRVRKFLGDIATDQPLAIFLDDIHVIDKLIQPQLLSVLYAVCRGNKCFLKISGIEQFSRPWNNEENVGLQPPHDAQILRLDYNLTMPDRSRQHISEILDAHARFCGLPNVSYVCGNGVISRLVWVAAAVPRDALNLFAQAVARASAQGQKRVSITSVNAAASEMAEQKLHDMQHDLRDNRDQLQFQLDRIKQFCINEKKKNAFLVEIQNESEVFQAIQSLIALRFVHVLHEGITPHEAGRRYQALMLDYGFYVGIRAARSVDLFQKDPTHPRVQELRKLPIFS